MDTNPGSLIERINLFLEKLGVNASLAKGTHIASIIYTVDHFIADVKYNDQWYNANTRTITKIDNPSDSTPAIRIYLKFTKEQLKKAKYLIKIEKITLEQSIFELPPNFLDFNQLQDLSNKNIYTIKDLEEFAKFIAPTM